MAAPATLLIILFASHVLTESNLREDRRFFLDMFTRRPPLRDDSKSCTCTCGERNVDGRIVGGEPTISNEFPWIVRLSYFNRFYCGGMLINDRYVLTAAHCIKGFMWFMIKVTFGEHDRCDKNAKPETRFVLRAISGDFSYLNFDHDIALLRLNDKVPITETIRPICLPTDTKNKYVGTKAIATGWGTLVEDGKPACILQEVELPVMSNADCKKTNYSEQMISDNMMCAGYLDGKKDSCQGDSGGPLIRERPDKRYELIGVVSWGNGCARPGYPGIYTRVTRYLDWIKSNSAEGCWCDDTPKDEDKPQKPSKKPVKPTTTQKPQKTTMEMAQTSASATTSSADLVPISTSELIETPLSQQSTPKPQSGTMPKPEMESGSQLLENNIAINVSNETIQNVTQQLQEKTKNEIENNSTFLMNSSSNKLS